MRCKAFTLIELLIVVAIIAILAAIAVPNFLEAQTRAKISRTKADMRSIGMAMTTYQLDHNWIPTPPGTGNGGVYEYLKWQDYPTNRVHGPGYLLTSPITYMSDIPYDVFNTIVGKRLSPHNAGYNVQRASAFLRGASKSGARLRWPRNEADTLLAIKGYEYLPECIWILSSAGPDLLPWPMTGIPWPQQVLTGNPNSYMNMEYDPTNGTISFGDIYMTEVSGLRGGGNH